MSNAPYSTVVSPLNPTFIDYPLSSLLGSAGATAPTATNGYCRYTIIGNLVNMEFKYELTTLGTTSVQYRFNLPIPMVDTFGGTRQKPQGLWFVRYSAGAGAQYQGNFGDLGVSSTSVIGMVSQSTFGGTPANFTSASPATLAIGDFIHGELRYEFA